MSKPVLLVHGAFTGAWAWDTVRAELHSRGIESIAVDLPSQQPGGTLAADAAHVRKTLTSLDSPVVLVGHSYSGAVITEASAGNADVAALVYVCAALPAEGESVADLLARDPEPGDLGSAMVPAQDGTATLTRQGAKDAVYNDATDEQAAPALDALGAHAVATLSEPVTGAGWREHPSTYVLALQDKSFSPALQRQFARHTGSVVELDTGHGPMLTQPSALATAIADVAGQ